MLLKRPVLGITVTVFFLELLGLPIFKTRRQGRIRNFLDKAKISVNATSLDPPMGTWVALLLESLSII